MTPNHPNLNLLILPPETEMPILLIIEELKTRKLFSSLRTIGLDECPYQPHLDSLILACLQLDADSEEVFRFYNRLMEDHSQKIGTDRDTISKEAIQVYITLTSAKKEQAFMRN